MSQPDSVSTVVPIDMVNSVEVLVNLAYLMEQDRHNPDEVLRYIRMANVTLKRMTSLLIQTQKVEQLEIATQ
jgi:hypothetical protein